MEKNLAVQGRFVHGVQDAPGELQLVTEGLLVVREGIIEAFASTTDGVAAALQRLDDSFQLIKLDSSEFCIPGMIDTHVHAPQYQFSGTATDLPLMHWLQHYTFPAEERMSDSEVAQHVYSRLVRRLLAHGTTTAVYFASIHLEATKRLVDICRSLGQRAFVGKVAMDQNGGDGYVETTSASLSDSEALVEYCYSCQPEATDAVEFSPPRRPIPLPPMSSPFEEQR